jgi:hypothetical protein
LGLINASPLRRTGAAHFDRETYDRGTTLTGGHARRRGLVTLAVLAGCALLVVLGRPQGAVAGTDNVILTVNLTSDGPDVNTADNICDADLVAAESQCTLRAAIQQANAFAGTDPT